MSAALWTVSTKADPRGARIADRHYSRRTPGSPQFMPPGEVLVLVRDTAVFGWWRPHPRSGIRSMNGLDGWTCSIFRNEGPSTLSSDLVLAAELALVEHDRTTAPCGPHGMLTYVWDARVRSTNPGYCFKRAGWHVAGRCEGCAGAPARSQDNRKTLLHKPFEMAGRT